MDESRIIIIGSNGQLGKSFQQKLPGAIAYDRDKFDLTDWELVQNFNWSNIDVILNAAAYTNVDEAETNSGRPLAWKINATGPGYLSKIASQHNIKLVHVSSDYVFNGEISPHPEDEDLSPLGVYGQTKAAGDIAVSTTPSYYIMRTHSLIGDGNNFVRTMVGLAKRDISPTVVSDQITRLTFTPAVVDATLHLLKTNAKYGVYNISNDGEPASWADITRLIFKEIGRDDLTVSDTTTEKYFKSKEYVSPRPLKSYFDLSKIKTAGFAPPDWRAELHKYIELETTQGKGE